MQELFNRVKKSESTKAKWRTDYNSTEWKEASKVSEILTGMPLNRSKRCECIEDMFFILKRANVGQKIKREMERQFFLKEDKTIMVHGSDPVTSNSTDEQLIALLKVAPAHIKNFNKVPDNWEEIVANYTPGKPNTTEAKSAPEVENGQGSDDSEVVLDAKRIEELTAMTNPVLKKGIVDMMAEGFAIEMPVPANKTNLVKAIATAEAIAEKAN